MAINYFCYGTTLAALVNVENVIATPAGVVMAQGGSPMPLSGGVGRRLLSKKLKRSGSQNSAWVWGWFENGMTELNTLRLSVFGDVSTISRELYVITLDEQNYYSPFLCFVDCPYLGQSMSLFNNPYDVRFDLVGGVLQYLTKTSNYTVTVSDHLIYCDTSGGSITLALPALAGVVADVPYRFVKTAAGNSLIFDGNGAETVDGGATKTVTALNASTTLIKTSATTWVSI